jgi:hypothetical protein
MQKAAIFNHLQNNILTHCADPEYFESIKFNKDKNLSLSIIGISIDYIFSSNSKYLIKKSSTVNIKYKKIKKSFRPSFKYLRRILKTYEAYNRSILHSKQYSTLRTINTILNVRNSSIISLNFIQNLFKHLKTKKLCELDAFMDRVDIVKLKNDLRIVKDNFDP